MNHKIEFVVLSVCFILFIGIYELVRRRQLLERYSILWFFTFLSLAILGLHRELLTQFSSLIGVYYPPSSLFIVLIFFLILILIHFSTVLSQLLKQNQILSQKAALLEYDLNLLTEKIVGESSTSPKSNKF